MVLERVRMSRCPLGRLNHCALTADDHWLVRKNEETPVRRTFQLEEKVCCTTVLLSVKDDGRSVQLCLGLQIPDKYVVGRRYYNCLK
jgi:hypothetical protein